MINHMAINMVTKGLLNISNITKGVILVYEIVSKRKKGGSSSEPEIGFYNNDEEFFKEIRKRNIEEIDVIKVKIDWKKTKKISREIEAILLKKHIEAEILDKTGKNIKVKIV